MASSSGGPPPGPPDLLCFPDLASAYQSAPSVLRQNFHFSDLVPELIPAAENPVPAKIPEIIPTPVLPQWVSKLKVSHKNLSKVGTPSVSEDGIPTVQVPDTITLSPNRFWKDYVVALFHGNPPSAAKVFADLNPIWGKQGKIIVKQYSTRVYFIYIPCEVTRNLVVEVGYWQSENCAFSALLWEPNLNLVPSRLVRAPIWVLCRNIPKDLWSFEGFSTIATGLGGPIHSEFPVLKPYSNGVTKLKVDIDLEGPRPKAVRVRDKLGNSVLVAVEFLKPPPKCNLCQEFGHLPLRCPNPPPPSPVQDLPEVEASSSAIAAQNPPAPLPSGQHIIPRPQVSTVVAVAAQTGGSIAKETLPATAPGINPPDIALASRDSPDLPLPAEPLQASDQGWNTVSRKKPPLNPASLANRQGSTPLSSSQLAAEEDVIKAAQEVIRRCYNEKDKLWNAPSAPTGPDRKKARRRLRQHKLLLSNASSDTETTKSLPVSPSSASGRSRSRSVPPFAN
ncbi:hypothetical protein Bca101_067228 [Brassica carinata]